MRPRQPMPFQWGIQPQRQQGPFHWGSQPPRTMRQMQGPPFQSNMGMPPRTRQGGGLLAKILGKRNPAPSGFFGMNPGSMAAPAQKGSILKTLSDPTSINGFLTNTQQVLNSVQQIAPMVQQYGPLVRNLPAMWKLYRGLKDAPVETNEDSQEVATETNTESKPELQKKKTTGQDDIASLRISSFETGKSNPKLYI